MIEKITVYVARCDKCNSIVLSTNDLNYLADNINKNIVEIDKQTKVLCNDCVRPFRDVNVKQKLICLNDLQFKEADNG